MVCEPTMANDDFVAAVTRQEKFQDHRVQHFWDAENILGTTIAQSMLRNTPIAWDIYLLYQPGARWDDEKFPVPDFWMHQLLEDERRRLNPEVLQYQVMTAVDNLQKQKTQKDQ